MKHEPAERLTISVIIPHLNQADALVLCLSALAKGIRQPDQVIVVDNGSAELPKHVHDVFPNALLLVEPCPGPGLARNTGVMQATGQVLAFIDADCIPDERWLLAAEKHLLQGGTCILGGDVRIAYANADAPDALECYESIFAYRMDRYIAGAGFTGAGNMIVTRDVFDRVGPFKGRDIAEDRDWGQRAASAGFLTRYCPDVRVYHPARRSFADLCRKWDRQLAHDFAECHGKAKRLMWVAKAIMLAFSPVWAVFRVLGSDRISGPRSRILAAGILFRIRCYRAFRMMQLSGGLNPEQLLGRWNEADA